MRCGERHGDDDIALVIDFNAIDEAEIVDIDRDFRVVDFLECSDDRFLQLATGTARACAFGLLLQKSFQIVAFALQLLAWRFLNNILDSGALGLGQRRRKRTLASSRR